VSKTSRSVSGKAASKTSTKKNSTSVAFDADDLAGSIWVALAIKSGATASEALACQTASAPYALPKFCDSIYAEDRSKNVTGEGDKSMADINENIKGLWERSVTTMLTSDLPRWYAMHLRKGVSYDELRKEIAEGIHPAPELFYPSETIKKRIGSRTVIDDKPFITSTVFFKTYPEKILPMFSRIGDKAWCYRVTRGAGSPYAVISSTDMIRFQSVIGIFTPDIEIHPLGELIPKPGESVIIIKAGYNNRQGEVEEVINTESGSAIFRIKLSTDQGYEWRVDLDPHQIERLLK
ncbi:MAG: hypothetical protein K2L34_12480, partial [Muribaculaceae bacterium]|nr:hypothetical protein [Muribaculaceae bacterium]